MPQFHDSGRFGEARVRAGKLAGGCGIAVECRDVGGERVAARRTVCKR
jgi:hypothetical protein